MPTPKERPALIGITEAAKILGCTYERARQLCLAGTLWRDAQGRMPRKHVLRVAMRRAVAEQEIAEKRHQVAMNRLYEANRELNRVRGLE